MKQGRTDWKELEQQERANRPSQYVPRNRGGVPKREKLNPIKGELGIDWIGA